MLRFANPGASMRDETRKAIILGQHRQIYAPWWIGYAKTADI